MTFDDLKYEIERVKRSAARDRRVAAYFAKKVEEISALAARQRVNTAKAFNFKDYPALNRKVEVLLEELHDLIVIDVRNGVNDEWDFANAKNDALVEAGFGSRAGFSKTRFARYFSRNNEALEAFQKRKTGGLNFSDRVWNVTDQFKEELELALDLGIGGGQAATSLASSVKRYLKNPDALFRRVRDERGVLRLSEKAKAYHPGRGVYRSAAKNALRLTGTETNIAYRTADYDRIQSLDFVVGIQVKLSKNHTLNGVPFIDICDELKGVYPKWFKFTGWHPKCRCYTVTILADDTEIDKIYKAIMGGTSYTPKGAILAPPGGFDAWVKNNTDRAANWKSQPYFIVDNFKGGRIEGGLKEPTR